MISQINTRPHLNSHLIFLVRWNSMISIIKSIIYFQLSELLHYVIYKLRDDPLNEWGDLAAGPTETRAGPVFQEALGELDDMGP